MSTTVQVSMMSAYQILRIGNSPDFSSSFRFPFVERGLVHLGQAFTSEVLLPKFCCTSGFGVSCDCSCF